MAETGPTPQDTPDSDIRLEGVTKRFAETLAVDDLSLEIPRGSFFAMLGPSGCGKTTTLRMLAGFEVPTEGRILLEGEPVEDVPPYERNVNTVFQSYALFEHLSLFENIAFGLRRKKVAKPEINAVGTMMIGITLVLALALLPLTLWRRRTEPPAAPVE